MAAGTWEVKKGELVYSIGGQTAVKISGGLNEGLVQEDFEFEDDAELIDEYFGIVTDPTSSADHGVITLKKAALGTSTADIQLTTLSGISSYKLALFGGSTVINNAASTVAAKWTLVNGTASYFAQGTPAKWSLGGDSTTITYTPAVQNDVLAAITGMNNDAIKADPDQMLKRYVTIAEGASKGTITFAENVLERSSTISLVAGSKSYALALATDITQFDDKPDDQIATLAMSGTSAAKITRTRVGGWLIADGASSISFKGTDTKVLASITGLSEGTLADYLSLGTKTDKNSVITLQKLALGTNSAVDVILTDEDESDNFTFGLGFEGGGSKLGFEEIAPYWSLSGVSTAIYQKSTKEGWTLSGTSRVFYTPQEDPTMLATITNLSSGISVDGNSAIAGITVGDNVITLARDVLNTNPSAAITLENGNEQNFSLALAGGISQEPADLGNSLSIAAVTGGAASTSATIFKTYSEAWSVSGTSKIVYTGASSKVLATINGLSIGALSDAAISMSEDGSNILITLQQRALRAIMGESGAVTLIDNNLSDGINFSLSLAAGVSKPDELTGTPYLSIVSGSGGTSTANIVHDRLAGWTLSGTSKIVYTGGESIVLATITGLSSGALSSVNIHLVEKDDDGKSIITLDRGALVAQSGASVVLTDTDATDGFTFVLALSGGVSSPGTEFENWSLSVANGAASVIANKHEGWTLATDEDKITYTPEQIGIFATIAGLSNDALSGVNITLGKKDDDGKSIITLGTSALIAAEGASVVLTDTDSSDGFDFALALSGVSSPATTFTGASLDLSSISSTGIASISGIKSAGWTLAGDSNSVSYVAPSAATLGTIEGLSLGTTSTAITFDGLSVITLKNGSLSKTSISLESDYDAFSLSLASDIVNYNGGGSVGFRPIYYWEKNSGNTTAYYRVDTSEGWTLAEDSKGVTYTAESHDKQIVATITKLNSEIVSASGVIEGISVSAIAGQSVITLSQNVLGVGDPMKLTNRTEFGGDVANYSLSLNADSNIAGGSVPTAGVSTFAWTTLGTTARYSKIETAYWTLEGDTITYMPQQNNDIVATLTGLNSAVQEADMTVEDTDDDGTYEIMLNKNALAGRNVTLAGTSYVLTLNRSTAVADRKKKVDAPTLSGGKWEINRTTATYKVTLTEGYEVSNDGTTVIHTTAGETALLTITGLKSGLTVNAYGEISGIKIGIIDDTTGDFVERKDGTGTVIQLSEDVLGTGTVAINGTGLGVNYTLVLDENVMTEEEATEAKGDVWRVDGTTAVYKEITPAYYTLASDSKSITYTAEADTAGGGTKATVTGLKSGLSVGTDGEKTWVGVATTLDGVTTVAPDLEIDDSDNTHINLTKDVLTNSDVKVESDSDSYVLYLGDTDTVNSLKPVLQTGTLSFVQDGTTETKAYLKGTMSEGYLVKSGDKEILYKGQDTAYTLATIEGLKTGLSTSDFTGNNAGLKLAGDIITVSAKMLGDTNVTINNGKDHEDTAYDYEFALGENVVTTDNAGTKNVWAADTSNKTKYIYKTIVPTHYDLNISKSNKEITRTGENAGTNIVTLTGLKSDLYIDDETRQIEGITVTTDTSTGKTEILISGDVLNDGDDATYTTESADYTIAITDDIKPVNNDPYWTVSGTTATYQYDTTAGYVVDTSAKKIKYQADKTPDGETDATKPTAIVTITNLRSGLSTDARDNIDGITVDTDKIILSKDVLGTDTGKILTLTNGKTLAGETATYALALNGESFGEEENSVITDTTVDRDATGWEVASTGVATLKDCTTSGYTIDNTNAKTKTIKYSEAKLGSTVLAKVENLSGISVNGEKQIAGIDVDKANTKITLSKDVLGTDATKNVKVTSGSYTLALNKTAGDDGYVPAPEYDGGKWTVKSGTATFTETTTAGYKIDDGANSETNGQVVYLPGKVVTSKISGLNTVVKTDNIKTYITFAGQDDDEDGIGKGVIDVYTDGDNKDKNIGTFTIKKTALITSKNSTAKLTNDTNYGAYTLKLAAADIAKSDESAPKWKKTNKDTKATYTITTQPGLRRSTDGLTITNSTSETYQHLATLTGLKKDVEATADGTLAGVSFDANDSENKTILLGPEILATSNVTVTGKTLEDKEYILALNESGSNDAADPANTNDWYEVQYAKPTLSYNKTKGTVSIIGGKTAGWEAHRQTEGAGTTTTEDDKYEDKTIYYTAAAPETIATISGLKFTGNTVEGLAIDDWERTGDTGEANINLTKDSLTNKNVKVTVPDALKEKYTFKLVDINGNIPKPTDDIKFWTSDGKGNVTYKYRTSEGYTLNDDEDTLTYSTKAITTLAKITGLKNVTKISNETTESINGITVESYVLEEGEVKTPGKLVLNSSDILGNKAGNKIKLTSDYYNFDLASDLKTQDIGTPKWYISGTTATLKTYTTAGYALTGTGTTEGKVVEYKNETAATNEIVKITGLKKNLKADTINEEELLAFDKVTNLIKPDASVLGTGTITLTNGEGQNYKFDATEITKPTEQTPVWKFSNGTATLKQTTTAGHTLDDAKTKLTYSPEKTPTVATVKGLNTKLKLTQNGEIGLATGTKVGSKTVYNLIGEAAITFDGTVITVNEDALNKKTITVSGEGYTLAFGNLTTNTEKKEATEWTVSGTTGTYKKYDKDYYTLNSSDSKSITYTKATKGTTYATVTGLKKNTTAADLNANWDGDATGGVLTLNQKQLGTSTVKIVTTLTNTDNRDGFTLALSTSTASDEVVPLSKVENVSSATSDKNGKAVLKGTVTTGYSLAFGNKSITYSKTAKTGQVIATVTGLTAGKSISADANGVITLTEDKLNKKNVTVTTSKGNVDYTLALPSAVTAPVFDDITGTTEKMPKEPGWTNPSGTATLKGYVATAGYTALEGGKAIIYTKATDTKNKSKTDTTQVYKSIGNLATIKGMTSGKEPSISGDTIVVDGGKTSGNLTIDGGAYKVEVKSNFQNRSITGSSKADQIEIAGTGVSVTGGKGNDYIDLGNKNNHFIYSNGDGDDVIANFTAGKDALQVKSGTVTVGRTSDNDILVKVGSGSIKLLDTANVTELTVIGKNDNTTKTYAIPKSETNSGYLLADDNYSTDAAQLSDIIKADSSSYTPYEFNSSFSLTKEETFTPTTTSNGSSKKK